MNAHRFKKGSWQPARLRRVDHTIFVVWLIAIGYIRGLDYAFGADSFGARNFMYAAAPSWFWGWFGFIAGSVILTSGVLSKRHAVVFVGHIWVGTAYTVNALALALASTADFPNLDGIRGAGAISMVGLIHLLGALRTGIAPLRPTPEAVVVAEEIATPGGGDVRA